MTRLQIPATIADAPEASRSQLEAVAKQLGRTPNIFRAIALSPQALACYLALSGALGKGSLPAATRERIALAVAEVNGCSDCLSAQTYFGRNLARLDDAEITANRKGASNDPKADAAVRFAAVVATHRGHVTDQDFAAVKLAGYTDAEIIEIVQHVALNSWTNFFNEVFHRDRLPGCRSQQGRLTRRGVTTSPALPTHQPSLHHFIGAFALTLYKFATVHDRKVFYREAGDPTRPTLVLLHGFPTSSFMFRDHIPLLADRFHVIAPDYIGFGHSDAPSVAEFDYSFENLTAHVAGLIEQLELSSYILYMQDYGGPVGFRLFTRNPKAVAGFVIQNTNAYMAGVGEMPAQISCRCGRSAMPPAKPPPAGFFPQTRPSTSIRSAPAMSKPSVPTIGRTIRRCSTVAATVKRI